MKKLVLSMALILLVSSAMFAAEGDAPKTRKACLQDCKTEERGCINVAEADKAKKKECLKNGKACRKACKKLK